MFSFLSEEVLISIYKYDETEISGFDCYVAFAASINQFFHYVDPTFL